MPARVPPALGEPIEPRIVRADEPGGYADADVHLRFIHLAADEERDLGPSEHPRLLVLGGGRGHLLGTPLAPGDVVVVPPAPHLRLRAGATGLSAFEARAPRAPVSPPGLRVEPRVRLGPFPQELIIAPAGAPFRLGAELSLAEVLVPPGVTTSQHSLGVDERYLLLSGPATMGLGEHEHPVTCGDVVAIPAGVLQHIRNDSPDPLRLYCLCTPPFVVHTYRPGPVDGHGPEGFSLDAWWQRHRGDYEGSNA